MTDRPTDLDGLRAAVLAAVVDALGEMAPDADLPPLAPAPPEREEHGDLSLPCHPLARVLRRAPQQIAADVAERIGRRPFIATAEAVSGFLNVRFQPEVLARAILAPILGDPEGCGRAPAPSGRRVMVEFSSPNTNKPQHLGHVRNNLLGAAISNLLEARGDEVIRANLINDRGIHICKSMVAYRRHGRGRTPATEGVKGDLFVGGYYVLFDRESAGERRRLRLELEERGLAGEELDAEVERRAPLLNEARDLLRRWEAGDAEVVDLWRTMNGWVYEGFDETYRRLGIRFDKVYHESETYQLGRRTVLEALERGVCARGPDGSVWIDLTDEDLDRKLLLRADGTSVYITQDIGTAQLKHADFDLDRSLYVVGSEQDYHFKVLFLTLARMGFPWARGLEHVSYGMVFLPEGKMKSREGKVVDADDLMAEVVDAVRERMTRRDADLRDGSAAAGARGAAAGVAEHSAAALQDVEGISEAVGMGALKFYMLKFGPRKDFTFRPDESISLQGDTGPYVQFAYTRIIGILRKAGLSADDPAAWPIASADLGALVEPEERALMRLLGRFDDDVQSAAEHLNPAALCATLLGVAQAFHRFVHDHPVLAAPTDGLRDARLCLSIATGIVLRSGLRLLGIDAPERM